VGEQGRHQQDGRPQTPAGGQALSQPVERLEEEEGGDRRDEQGRRNQIVADQRRDQAHQERVERHEEGTAVGREPMPGDIHKPGGAPALPGADQVIERAIDGTWCAGRILRVMEVVGLIRAEPGVEPREQPGDREGHEGTEEAQVEGNRQSGAHIRAPQPTAQSGADCARAAAARTRTHQGGLRRLQSMLRAHLHIPVRHDGRPLSRCAFSIR
jgi:hypothetical protein